MAWEFEQEILEIRPSPGASLGDPSCRSAYSLVRPSNLTERFGGMRMPPLIEALT